MGQDGQLGADGGQQLGVRVAERQDPSAVEKIDEHVAVEVFDVGARAAAHGDRQPPRIRANARLALLLTREELGRGRTGNGRGDSRFT